MLQRGPRMRWWRTGIPRPKVESPVSEKYEPYPDDQALAGPDMPPMKTIMDMIRYCITVHERFGNTCVEDVRLKWGGCALNARGDKDIEIERLQNWVNDLQADMYINCVYCGHRYGPDDEVPAAMADTLKEHIAQCPEHPMSKLTAEHRRMEVVCVDILGNGWDDAKPRVLPVIKDFVSGRHDPCANGHDLVSRGDGTAKCADCDELADVTETGAARSGNAADSNQENSGD